MLQKGLPVCILPSSAGRCSFLHCLHDRLCCLLVTIHQAVGTRQTYPPLPGGCYSAPPQSQSQGIHQEFTHTYEIYSLICKSIFPSFCHLSVLLVKMEQQDIHIQGFMLIHIVPWVLKEQKFHDQPSTRSRKDQDLLSKNQGQVSWLLSSCFWNKKPDI